MLRENNNEIQNIFTIELETEDSEVRSYTIDIEDEGTKRGDSLESLRDFIEACTYVLHNTHPSDPFADPIMMSRKTKTVHIYTHELSTVFQYLRNVFKNDLSVFTNKWMSPITAYIRLNNVVFTLHDTSRLVPKTIEEWAEDENIHGNVVMEGIKKYREKYGNLQNIPCTQTGEVRRECRRKVTDKEWLMSVDETIASYDLETYTDLVTCFMGGTLGVSPAYKGTLLRNVYSDDLGSAYPGVMATRKFPVSPWEDSEYVPSTDYFHYLKVRFTNVKAKGINKFYPFNKATDGENQISEGLALSSADEVTLTLTDIDFEIFKKNYTYETCEIIKCRRSKAGYLPKQLVKLILKNYADKTELKGTDEVSKYREAKIKNNCMYGIAVTKTITDDIIFEKGEWKKHELKNEEDFNKARDELLKTKNFLTYQIGVWVTAYVREILWNIIPEIDMSVVYFDTDCIKHTTDTDIFRKENDRMMYLIKEAAAHHHINVKKFCPKDRPIGCFEEEDFSYEFKALDVKRYAKRTDKGVEGFISGMPKYHIKLNSVKELSNNMSWSEEESGRYNISYIDGKVHYVSKKKASFTMREYNDFDAIRLISGLDISDSRTNMFKRF